MPEQTTESQEFIMKPDKMCKHTIRFDGVLPNGFPVNMYFPKDSRLGTAKTVKVTLVPQD
jgi:hypothetical protein